MVDKIRVIWARGYIRAWKNKVEVHANVPDVLDMVDSALKALTRTTGTVTFDLWKDLQDRVRLDLEKMGYDLDEMRGEEDEDNEEE